MLFKELIKMSTDVDNSSVVVIVLSEGDVPGAKLPHENVEVNSNHQLKRWLECRGLPRTGNRSDLISRQVNCMYVVNNITYATPHICI